MIINEMPGGISLNPTTASAAQILNGYTAYNGSGDFLTGSMLNTVTTANASCIMNGYTAYSNLGELIVGNKNMDISGGETFVLPIDEKNPTRTMNIGVFPKLMVEFIGLQRLYFKLLRTDGSNAGNFYVDIPTLNISLNPGSFYNWDYKCYESGSTQYWIRLQIAYNLEGVLSIALMGRDASTPTVQVRTYESSFAVNYTGTQLGFEIGLATCGSTTADQWSQSMTFTSHINFNRFLITSLGASSNYGGRIIYTGDGAYSSEYACVYYDGTSVYGIIASNIGSPGLFWRGWPTNTYTITNNSFTATTDLYRGFSGGVTWYYLAWVE